MTRAQHRYFISHAPSDHSQVIQLYMKLLHVLNINGLFSDSLPVSRDRVDPRRLNHRQESALNSCSTMIVLLSKEAIEKGPALSDVSYALEAYETIILVKIKPCTLPYYLLRPKTLSHIQSFYVDLTQAGELDFTPLNQYY